MQLKVATKAVRSAIIVIF